MKKFFIMFALVLFGASAVIVPAYAKGGADSGGSATTATTTGGGTGGGKTVCDPYLLSEVTSGYFTGAMGITATYTPATCLSGNTTNVFAFTNLATGVTEYSVQVPGNTFTWTNPAFDTDYRVDIKIIRTKDASVVGTKSLLTHTPVMVANCAAITNYNLSAGYWINYAAIWTAYQVNNCGYGRQNIVMRITNQDTGMVEATYSYLPSATMIDFEGPVVKYDTNYQIEVEVHGAQNELLDYHVETTHTPVMR
jgi:hypothetical protein